MKSSLPPTHSMRASKFSPARLHAFFAAFIALFFVSAINDAHAQQDIYWRNDTGSTVWWNDSNKPWYYATWTSTEPRPDYWPVPTRNLLNFDNNNQTTTTVNGATFEILSLRIHGTSTGRTFNNSSGKINVSVGITNDVSHSHTFNVDIDLGGSTVNFTGNTGNNMTFNNAIALGGNKALFGGSSSTASFTINGLVSGSGGQIELDNGFLVLANSGNSYTGATTVDGGTLEVTANNGLGTTAAGTTVASGATLDFKNVNYSTTEGVTLNGGTIATTTGSSTFAGGVTLGASSVFNITGTSLTQSGAITDGSGTFGITKNGSGNLVLSTANTYDGSTTINGGLLIIADDNRLGSTTSAGISIGAAYLGFDGSFTLNSGRAVTLTANGGGLDVFGTRSVTYNGAIGESGGARTFEKRGGGTLTLGGNNTYTGATTVSVGAVRATSATAFGTTAGGVSVTSGAAVELSGTTTIGAEALTLNGDGIGTGGALRNVANDNTWQGAITLNSASRINSDLGTLSLSGSIGGAQALTLGGAGNTAISGAVTVGNVTKDGNGALTFSSDSSSFGTLAITAGSLAINGNTAVTGLSGSGSMSIANSKALTVNNTSDQTFSGAISGSGGLTKSGNAILNLTGTGNSYSGATTISGGMVTLSGAGSAGGTSAGISIGNGFLGFNGTFELASGKSITLTAAGSGLDVYGTQTATYNGNIGESGGTRTLDKRGTGTLILGGNSTYSGLTTISNGVVRATSAGAFGATNGGVSVVDGAAVELSGGSAAIGAEALTLNGSGISSGGALRNITGNNSWAGNITLNSASRIASDAGTLSLAGTVNQSSHRLTISGASGVTISGDITGTTTGDILKQGAGALTLSGNNSGLNPTGNSLFIDQGTVYLNHNNAGGAKAIDLGSGISGAGSAALYAIGGRTIGNAITVQGENTTTLSIGSDSTADDNTFTGNIALEKTANFNAGSGRNVTFSTGVISGNGGLTKTGSGTVILSGANTYTGATTVSLGTLRLGAANAIANGSSVSITSGAAFDLNGNSDTINALTLNGTGISSGGAIINSSETAATLTLGAASSLGSASSIGGTGNITIGGNSAITAGSATTLTKVGANTLSLQNGGGDNLNLLVVVSGGVLELAKATSSGVHAAGGATVNNGGTLRLAGTGGLQLWSGSTPTVNTGGVFDLNGRDQTFTSAGPTINGTGIDGGGALVNGNTGTASTLTSALVLGSSSSIGGAGNFTITGAISGGHGLTKVGAGTVTLSAAATYTGATTVSAGRLSTGSAMSTSGLTLNGGEFHTTGGNILSDTATVTVNGGQYTLGGNDTIGALSGSGGTIALGGNFLTTSANTDTSFAGALSGTGGGLTKQGTGVLSLSGVNTLLGGLFIDQGVLNLAGGSLAAGSIDIGGGIANRAINTQAATLRVTAANNFGRNIIVKNEVGPSSAPAGDRSIDFANASDTTATLSGSLELGKDTSVSVASGATGVLSGVISSSGGLTKSGNGTLTLSGSSANTYSGSTILTAGTLNLNKSTNVAAINGPITINSGATLLLSSSGNVADTSAVTLSGGTITRGAGVNEAFASLNLTTGSFLDFGTGSTGSMTFGTYEENTTPSALLTINNFLPGNSFTFSNAQFAANGSNIGSYFTFGTGFQGQSITDLGGGSFTITAIPEPSAYVAAAGLLAMFLWPARRRLMKDAKSILGLRAPARERFEDYRNV